MHVVEVVDHPGCEQLAQRDGAELRVPPLSRQIRRRDQPLELFQIGLPGISERRQQVRDRPPGEADEASLSVYRLERVVAVVRQDDARPVDPVRLLDVNEVPADFVRRPGVRCLTGVEPLVAGGGQQRGERVRSPAEHLSSTVDGVTHTAP
jgi:hypothetical protein